MRITENTIDQLIQAFLESSTGRLLFLTMIGLVIALIAVMIIWLLAFRSSQKHSGMQQTQLVNALNQSTGALDKMQMYLNESQQANSENYLMIKVILDRYLGLVNDVVTKINSTQSALGDLLVETTAQHIKTQQVVSERLTNELDHLIEELISQNRLTMFDDFVAPSPHDCRWEIVIIRSHMPDSAIQLYKAPILKDNNTAGVLRGSGEVVKVIEDIMFNGWIYITQLYGESPVSGYARSRAVDIVQLTDKESSNVQT